MQLKIKIKINLKRYFFLASVSTFLLFLLTDKSLIMLLALLGFCGVTLSNQWMLMLALNELLMTTSNSRRMDRWDKVPTGRIHKELGKTIRKAPLKGSTRAKCIRRQRDYKSILRTRWRRVVKNRKERLYNKNLSVKRNGIKIAFLVVAKLLILIFAIAFSVHFIQDRIIFPVINHVIQIIALALSVKKG